MASITLTPRHRYTLALCAFIAVLVYFVRPFSDVSSSSSSSSSSLGGTYWLPFSTGRAGGARVDGKGLREMWEKMEEFVRRPAWDHPVLQYPSRQGCPMGTMDRDGYFFHQGKVEHWQSVSSGQIQEKRQALLNHFRRLEAEGIPLVWSPALLQPPYQTVSPGKPLRGVIYAAGDGRALKRLRLSLHMLRNVLGSKLPVEIYHYPDELLNPGDKEGLMQDFGEGVTTVELNHPKVDGKQWQIKLQAFLSTQFTEFVWMDTDNLPLMAPENHFDTVEYSKSHAVFWSDLNKDHPDNAIWRYLARPCNDVDWPVEAGQIVYDKRGNNGLNYAVLHISNHMMDDSEFYGQLMYGDKDTFRIAFYLLGLDYVKAPRVFAGLGGHQIYGESSEESCGHTMMHWGLTPLNKARDPNYHPLPAFAHMILTKHSSNFQVDKVFSHFLRPILDKTDEPTLIRCPARWTGPCFAWELQGPDGLEGTVNGFEDGQGVLTLPLAEGWRDPSTGQLVDGGVISDGLLAIQQAVVDINTT